MDDEIGHQYVLGREGSAQGQHPMSGPVGASSRADRFSSVGALHLCTNPIG